MSSDEEFCRPGRKAGRRDVAWRILVAVAGMALVAGCGYPTVSRDAFEIAKAIDNVCNLKQKEKLPTAREIVSAKAKAGAITSREEKWFLAILDTADRGDWAAAAAEARRILTDQQRR